MRQKILVIGLDGAELSVIRKMANLGFMPKVASLIEEGAVGELTSTYPPSSAPAWSTFLTGKLPMKHGIFDFITKQSGSYELKVITSFSIRDNTLWDIIDRHGRRSVFINFPITYPPRKINGIMISGMLSPGGDSDFIYPKSLRQELEQRFGRYLIDVLPLPYIKKNNLKQFLSDLNLMTEQCCNVALYCLEKENWDFFMVLFLGLDRLQHALWDCIDLDSHPPGAEDKSRYFDYVRQYFRKIDSAVAKILQRLDNHTNTIIVSDHGFGPLLKKIDINNWLAKVGLLKFKKNKEILKQVANLLKFIGIDRRKACSLANRFGLNLEDRIREVSLSVIDWHRTKAFACLSDSIYINLKGRERYGIVEAKEEYRKITDEIIRGLLELEDPESGQRIIYKVQKKEDLYFNNGRDNLPDLLLTEYDRRYLPVWCSGYREIGGPVFLDSGWQTGSHRLKGLFIGQGPDVKKGWTLQGAEIQDLLPTILHMLEIPAPQDLDGKILSDILK